MLECASIEEVHDCIDRIDDQNVRLIAERHRKEEIIQRVRGRADWNGIDPPITERIYRAMRWLGELDT
ncbi:hypothetical protein OS242_02120 [Tumebacillus sp. DT12]|uniref:Chorismate mutase domain-containing protein n=1 Tax=Tumebacillus lacus TaxID=2995335 RepID=A0ABT3WYD1_9BACL|nr:hypothetical protein [Tumebacillus lacus]MCX7568767.1 hypothetical protein [Tumebacillus lacus]